MIAHIDRKSANGIKCSNIKTNQKARKVDNKDKRSKKLQRNGEYTPERRGEQDKCAKSKQKLNE